jgi:hypothetical protein
VKELVSPPWLWLFGACGAGKTATGFELYRRLGAEGHRVGFIVSVLIGARIGSSSGRHMPTWSNASAAQCPTTATSVDTDNREPGAIADDIAATAFTS